MIAAKDSQRSVDSHLSGSRTFTRSQSAPYNSNLCFFCEDPGSYKYPLHRVAIQNTGSISVKEAIKKSGNEKLRVKLSTTLDPQDAHAIDIRYHKHCWTTEVTHVLRKTDDTKFTITSVADKIAADIEFLCMLETTLQDGFVVSMSSLEDVYVSILTANNVKNIDNSRTCRRKLKQLIQSKIPGVEFHKPKRVNEAERVSIKSARDAAIQQAEDADAINLDANMKTLYDAASVLRKALNNTEKWEFTGSLTDVTEKHLPKGVYSFFRWVVQGPNTTLTSDKKSSAVNQRATSLSQSTVSMFLSKRQAQNTTRRSVEHCTPHADGA